MNVINTNGLTGKEKALRLVFRTQVLSIRYFSACAALMSSCDVRVFRVVVKPLPGGHYAHNTMVRAGES